MITNHLEKGKEAFSEIVRFKYIVSQKTVNAQYNCFRCTIDYGKDP